MLSTLRLAWRNVGRNPRRTGIVIAAVAIGMAGTLLSMAIFYGMMFQIVDNAIKTETLRGDTHRERGADSLGSSSSALNPRFLRRKSHLSQSGRPSVRTGALDDRPATTTAPGAPSRSPFDRSNRPPGARTLSAPADLGEEPA